MLDAALMREIVGNFFLWKCAYLNYGNWLGATTDWIYNFDVPNWKKATGNFVSTTKALTKKSRIAKLTLTGVSASCNPRHISWDIYRFLHLSQLAIINIKLGRRVKKNCHGYLIRQSVFLWNVPMKLSVFENQHTYVTIKEKFKK